MKVVPMFFDDVATARRIVRDKVSARRKSLGLTYQEVDKICRLGIAPPVIENEEETRTGTPNRKLPTMEEFESDTNLISRRVLSRLMFPLGLQADELLSVDWENLDNQKKLQDIQAHMKAEGFGVVAAAGGSATTIDSTVAAKVYVVLKALEEIDAEKPPVTLEHGGKSE